MAGRQPARVVAVGNADAAEIVIVTMAVADVTPSDAFTVCTVATVVVVGVPEMTPVDAFMVNPAGRAGEIE